MKKFLQILLLFTAACTSGAKQVETIVINDLDVDFPTVDTLHLAVIQEFNILPEINRIYVKDTVAYIFEQNKTNFGYCYSINSGEKLAEIIGRGSAKNEMIDISPFNSSISNDSIQIVDSYKNKLKIFSIEDILTKPLGERVFSVLNVPDSILLINLRKLDNGLFFGIRRSHDNNTNKLFFSQEGGEISSYGTIPDAIFKPKNEGTTEIKHGILINAQITNRGDMVAISLYDGIFLNIVDSKKKEIVKERYYNNYQIKEGQAVANSHYKTSGTYSNDKNIFIISHLERDRRSDDAARQKDKVYLLVYDWELNPIKRYYLGDNVAYYFMSDDCKMVHLLSENEQGKSLLGATVAL